jgi:23S rRNA (uridine2552-2'-O)-methyltransferase
VNQRWLAEHRDDVFVKRAKEAGYRSRSALKLLEIERRDRLLVPGSVVVDLGAAPGGWSQVAAQRVAPHGKVVALDLLPIEDLPGVTVIQGDVREPAVMEALVATIGDPGAHYVLSDMSPNISGLSAIDQPRALHLAELALALAKRILIPHGAFLVKVFQGSGYDAFLSEMRRSFAKVFSRKPKASRPRSREVYLLGKSRVGSVSG